MCRKHRRAKQGERRGALRWAQILTTTVACLLACKTVSSLERLVKKCQYTYTAASRPKLERGCELNVKVPGWGLGKGKGLPGDSQFTGTLWHALWIKRE